jgi:hypothetical protein
MTTKNEGLNVLTQNLPRQREFFFGPIPYHLHNLADIRAFTGRVAGLEKLLLKAITGTGIRSGHPFGKHRPIVKITENTGMNREGRLTAQMVEKKISELQMSEIGLITHQFDVFVLQEFISGKPGDGATAAFFKYFHSFTG